MKTFFKKYFVAGLLILLPLWLTYFVFMFIFEWTSSFSMPFFHPLLKHFTDDASWILFLAKVLSFFLTLLIICFAGFLATNFIGKKILKLFENVLEKIPAIGSIYSVFKKFTSFFSNGSMSKDFQKVVFVPFPNKNTYCVAFSTGKKVVNGKNFITVFMPTTPNPTTGFLLLIQEEDVIESEYSVEEGIQYIMSAGIISPNSATNLDRKISENNNDNI